ncbi:hypothetical protein AB4Y96_09415 [Phyllobacterium sp. TAF24]|uniref:hypothetical protein n=1 Tax=Phyllobacterium sp. TAF24 TaxID=3233068 RepID=UPI003F9C4F4B
MILAALKYWQVIVGAILGALIASAPIYFYGKNAGVEQAAITAAIDAAQAYQERAKTNEIINSLDAVALCIELGGMPDECTTELRGLAKDHSQTGNSGLPSGK